MLPDDRRKLNLRAYEIRAGDQVEVNGVMMTISGFSIKHHNQKGSYNEGLIGQTINDFMFQIFIDNVPITVSGNWPMTVYREEETDGTPSTD